MILALALTAHRSRAQSTYTPYAFTKFAGQPGGWGNVDGTGSAARFTDPNGVATDSAGNVYVADGASATIRKITSAGVVTTLAGSTGQGGSDDGTGSSARFGRACVEGSCHGPTGVAVDSAGNVYVADLYNSTVRKITPAGVVTTLAGSVGQCGNADGTGSAAQFCGPTEVALDSTGNVYVADSANSTIRKITPDGVVTTLAGSAGQRGIDDGTGAAARFSYPIGLAVDSAGNVYVADVVDSTIRKITPDAVVTTLAGSAGQLGSDDGTGSAARFNRPWGLAVDSADNLYVTDSGSSTIRKITPDAVVTTVAGSAGQWGSDDGTGGAARFGSPNGVAVDSTDNLYVADTGNSTIRKITPAAVVTTLAGSAPQIGSDDGTGSAARFNHPNGLALDSADSVYVADLVNSTIRKITPGGVVTTLAGSAAQIGSNEGTGSAARFYHPSGVAPDSAGNLYVADSDNSTIRKITPAGVVTTLAGSAGFDGSDDGIGSAARFYRPSGVAVDRTGNVYVGDYYNNTIRKITPAGEVTTLAGGAGQRGSDDGTGSAARFNGPGGVAVDSAGNVFVADQINSTIRKITPAGAVTTLAGSAGQIGSDDGTGSAARFNGPAGVAVDAVGSVYVADYYNNTIRKITPAGAVTTLGGKAGQVGSADGIGTAAQFNGPSGVAIDSAGNVYVADSGNNRITKGTLFTLSTPLQFLTGTGSLTISNDFFQMHLTGPSGSDAVVEVSANLQSWTPVQTNALPSEGLTLSLPLDRAENQFFRARLAPIETR